MSHFNSKLLLLALAAMALSAATPYKISPSPLTAKRGDSLKISIVVDGCTKAQFDRDKSLVITGGGVTLDTTNAVVTACSIVITAKVATDAAFGDRELEIYDAKQENRLGGETFSVVENTPGPIPPGLNPQVDVMWNVLSEVTCSDQFGVRIARHYYCVEVSVGNNSGYPLLLAGVGFARMIPGLDYKELNVSYLNVRASAEREHVISGRNVTLRSLQAVGITIAGFAPFARNPFEKGRLNLWSSVFGSVLGPAFDGLVPDRTIVQTHNLDDAALRDGKLIQNNSPVRFTIFVDRDSIKPLLLPRPQRLAYEANLLVENAALIQADVTARQAAGTIAPVEAAQLTAQAKVLENGAENLKTSLSHMVTPSGGSSTDQAKAPPQSMRTEGSRHRNLFLGRHSLPAEGDLIQVRYALGKLILVGDLIEYKQRIKVDSAAVNPEILPAPRMDGFLNNTPVAAEQGQKTNITLVGKWLGTVTVNLANCSGCTVGSAVADSSGTELKITDLFVPKDYTAPTVTLIIANGSSSPTSFTVPVHAQKPTVANITPSPTWAVGSDGPLAITITGDFLKGPSDDEVSVSYTPAGGGQSVDIKPEAGTVKVAVDKITFTVKVSKQQSVAGASLKFTVTTRGGNDSKTLSL